MKSKIRYIPLVVLGAVILSLMAIIPAFSATGEIEFFIHDDTDEEQTWTKQGGLVGIRLDDPDLDVAEKHGRPEEGSKANPGEEGFLRRDAGGTGRAYQSI